MKLYLSQELHSGGQEGYFRKDLTQGGCLIAMGGSIGVSMVLVDDFYFHHRSA